MKAFHLWWVAEVGCPPTLENAHIFKMCEKAYSLGKKNPRYKLEQSTLKSFFVRDLISGSRVTPDCSFQEAQDFITSFNEGEDGD